MFRQRRALCLSVAAPALGPSSSWRPARGAASSYSDTNRGRQVGHSVTWIRKSAERQRQALRSALQAHNLSRVSARAAPLAVSEL
eukprot:scaffold189951_cov28-Tisochrysis_lutea.AAC.3